ncbi:hypothetical protein GLAREA_11685 [Glarea lozoyensis ATCC 20868]|uniref:Uncharacterized protein n=1 Tax=Glarea lozoyensis (strain ATCC 20868 / MF5171) TaxID=1116229 RepID=S3CIK6_GLAL2|nr:uncharacterized protein GLAREA_11685 [Glarea lozoyensis ATCC 20868]EPE25104.1 hypothetical protein GLAREA_11685 [Glarea lozoyensis ATCC 20868]
MIVTESLMSDMRSCLTNAKSRGILDDVEFKRSATRSFPIKMPVLNPSSDTVENAVPATGSAMFKIDIKGGPYQKLKLSETVGKDRLWAAIFTSLDAPDRKAIFNTEQGQENLSLVGVEFLITENILFESAWCLQTQTRISDNNFKVVFVF